MGNEILIRLFTDPLPVPMSSLETSGAIPRSVRPVMPANIAIRGLSNSFIRKSTNLPNVTIYKTPAIVPEVHSAHLLMLNVSLINFSRFTPCDFTRFSIYRRDREPRESARRGLGKWATQPE